MKPSCQVAVDQGELVAVEKHDVLETTITTAPGILSYLLPHFFCTSSYSMSSFLDVT